MAAVLAIGKMLLAVVKRYPNRFVIWYLIHSRHVVEPSHRHHASILHRPQMIPTIPPFGDAIRAMRDLLPQQRRHTPLLWLAREDFYAVRNGWFYLTPLPSCDAGQFNQYYEVGRARGIVSVHALFHCGNSIGCTLWFPQGDADVVQGWESGLKASVAMPLGIAARPGSMLGWKLHTLTPQFRRYTSFGNQSPTAADIRSAGHRAASNG